MLGMYVHTHWGYNRPYSARSWTLDDWSHYLAGLSRLGYDTVKVWPQIDTMPVKPTASDAAYLQTLARAMDVAHSRYGMKVILVLTANCMGNDQAAHYEFANRPYFICEKKVNPRDPVEMAEFLLQRRNTLAFVRQADAVAIIDSDPGGYIGSTNEDFANLCTAQMRIFRELNPAGEFIYWMLAGWEAYCTFWKEQRDNPQAHPNLWDYQKPDEFDSILKHLKEKMPEPWWLTCWLPQHGEAVDRQGLRNKAMFYPYGVIEGEPFFPLTVCQGGIGQVLTPDTLARHPLGVMGNAQTHCLQLYHTFLFAHVAQGGKESGADVAGFADRLLPGLGTLIAEGWQAIESSDSARQLKAARELSARVGAPHQKGDLAGLLFGDADRFISDLAMNLELRAALADFVIAVKSGAHVRDRLRVVLDRFVPYQERVGFVDAYFGPLYTELNDSLKKLDDPRLTPVLKDFDNWHNPSVRNGIVPRLIAAMQDYVNS